MVAAAVLRPPASRHLWESGVLYFALTSYRALPLFGFGCALGQVRPRFSVMAFALFALAVPLGVFAEPVLLSRAGVSQQAWTMVLALTGPFSCVVAGLALALGERWRGWVLLPAAAVLGGVLGIAVKLNDIGLHDAGFMIAAGLTGLWCVLSVDLIWKVFRRPWFAVAARILGSWLLAIGVMLGGAALVPCRPPVPVQPPVAAPEEGPGFPGGKPAFPDPGRPSYPNPRELEGFRERP